ncbi:MAG: ABC transporter substrate-binding protein [Candidatus Aminicenantes bacterium]|jgi:ABC-type branched-subunit amino acid transport system substrate-binding protein
MKRGKYLLSISILLIFITGILTSFPGCGKKDKKDEPGIEVYKIGAVLPRSGTQSYFGDESKAGIELAEKELRDGLKEKGVELEIIYEDSQNIPDKAASAALNLLNVKKVNCLISLFPMCPVVNGVTQGKNVLHMAATMSPGIAKPQNTLQIYPSQVEEAQKMIAYMESIKAQKVAIFHLTVKAHEETAAYIRPVLEKAGIENFTETMAFTDVDAKTQMQKIKDFKPDLLMLILLPDFHQKVFKAIHDVGGLPENCKIIGNISFLYPSPETPSEWLENVVFVAPKPFIGGVTLAEEFQKTFKEQAKMEPTIVSTFLYINIKILAEALLNGNTSSQDIINFLTATKTKFKTVAGEIEFLPDGSCTVSLGYGVIKDGKRLPFTLGQPKD